MISKEKFDEIKAKYGHYASWGVWAEEGVRPKDNAGDISVLDPNLNRQLLDTLNPNVVLVGLNISGRIERSLGNFHSPSPSAQDYKIRFALKNTPFWGAYITDVIKDFEQKCSGKMVEFLRNNPEFEKENIKTFLEELDVLGVTNPKIIAFGGDAYRSLKRHLPDHDINKVYHYSHFINKEKLREQFDALID
jgi:hypothetical protein